MATPTGAVTALAKPTVRPLRVYAFDPSAGRLLGNKMTLSVEYEPLEPGPIGKRLAVIDYDGTRKTYYQAVDLDDHVILIQNGIEPTQSDPRFHQQMVYAVAAETLQHFENCIGRSIRWRSGNNQLLLFPHAMAQSNAFYSPKAPASILFGYFRASSTQPGRNLPGQSVFTCLSHDIIAHEITHAIVDGIRIYFLEPTNVDVPAFHEAFADLAALFRHFTHKEALLDTLQKTGGELFQFQVNADAHGETKSPVIQAQLAAENPLIQLAQQFGEASGIRGGLRSALGIVNAKDIETKTEAHARGSILVAAVFDAYFTVYTRRTANLFRIYRAGGGSDRPKDLPGPLADMLAGEASRTAETFFTTCARALDFCPPVDITFGDFLRALITAHLDLDREDPDGVRDAFMEAFRLRGIVASSADFFSEDSLCWPKPDPGLPDITDLVFEMKGLTRIQQDVNGRVLRKYANTKANAERLGFDLKLGPIDAPSFHPVTSFRPRANGRVDVDLFVELVQTQRVSFGNSAQDLGTFPMRSGVTLVISQPSWDRPSAIRFVIEKRFSEDRQEYQRQSYLTSGLAASGSDNRYRIDFGLIHGGI